MKVKKGIIGIKKNGCVVLFQEYSPAFFQFVLLVNYTK